MQHSDAVLRQDRGAAGVRSATTFYGIQVLRGVAAMMVVCYHAASNLAANHPPGSAGGFHSLPDFLAGNAGVDLFFVISGFVIAWTTRDHWWADNAWSSFLRKRLFRVFPLYWLLTTAKLLLMFSLPGIMRSATPSGGEILSSYLLIPSWNVDGGITLIIVAGWTLCYEMAFYYLVTACLALRRQPIVYATPVLVALGLLGIVRTPEWGAAASLIDPLLLEFVAGMCIGEMTRRNLVRGRPAAMLALLTLGLAIWVASGWLESRTAFAWRVLAWGVPATAVLYAAVALEPWLSLRPLRVPLLIGDASYSIYLTHVFLLQPLTSGGRRLPLGWPGEWAVFVALVGLAAAFGVLVWLTVERTLMRGLAAALTDRRKRA